MSRLPTGRVTDRFNWKDIIGAGGEVFSADLIEDAGADEIYLPSLHAFLITDFRINTQEDGLGTDLTLDVDYEFAELNTKLTTEYGVEVYEKIKILNVTYQTGSIWAFGKYSGDVNFAEYFNTLQAQVDELITGLAGLNTGAIIEWGGNEDLSDIPMGWKACDGTELSRANYPEINALFEAAGYPWGNGDGSTTFNLPKGEAHTDWINRSLWQNKHLGSDTTKNLDSEFNHELKKPSVDIDVKLFISTDGTDANSFEARTASSITWNAGYSFYAVDNDNLIIQTSSSGIIYIDSSGATQLVDTEDWYYKLVATNKAMSARSIIKVEHITTAGEPVSALRYDTGWIANSDWTSASISVAHSLDTNLSDLIVNVFVSLDGTEANAIKVATEYTHFEDQTSSVYGAAIRQTNVNTIAWNTSTHGIKITTAAGTEVTLGAATAYYYKIVVTKPNLVATYADTSFRKVYDISDATDYTHTLPDASTQLTEQIIKRRGSGAGKVTMATVSSQTIDGLTASDWTLENEGTIVLFPYGGHWEVKEYEDGYESIHAVTTEINLYTALSPLVTNIGDFWQVGGTWGSTSALSSKGISRTASNELTWEYLDNSGGLQSFTIKDDGTGTAVDTWKYSISWKKKR